MPQFTTTVIAVAFILLAVGAVIGLLVLLYDWLAPLISRTTHGVSLPDSIGDLVSRLRRRRSRDDEDGDDDDDDELDDEAAALLSILPAASMWSTIPTTWCAPIRRPTVWASSTTT